MVKPRESRSLTRTVTVVRPSSAGSHDVTFPRISSPVPFGPSRGSSDIHTKASRSRMTPTRFSLGNVTDNSSPALTSLALHLMRIAIVRSLAVPTDQTQSPVAAPIILLIERLKSRQGAPSSEALSGTVL